jgi:hypothetical protein
MGAPKSLTTPRYKVKAALHQLFLRSRERVAAMKREGYCCEICGIKQSVAKGREVKIQVHHINGIDWEYMIDMVYDKLLCGPEAMRVLCKECHKKEHDGGNHNEP